MAKQNILIHSISLEGEQFKVFLFFLLLVLSLNGVHDDETLVSITV